MTRDYLKTLSFAALHFVAFGVAPLPSHPPSSTRASSLDATKSADFRGRR